MRKLSLWRTICLCCVFCAVGAIGSSAKTFKTLLSFDGTDGKFPSSLVQGRDGNYYGTTFNGGTGFFEPGGTFFKITPGGALTVLHNFCSQAYCTDGFGPNGLVLATDGNFYGTISEGGINCPASNCGGTVFKITPAGTLTTLYNFCSQTNCTDGSNPAGGLIQAIDGSFYGTTTLGGANSSACFGKGCGTVFKISPGGALTTLYSFCTQTNCTDGSNPIVGLVLATDGNFYGTTYIGGANSSACSGNGCGTVFKISPAGALTTLYSFCAQTNCTDGNNPVATLVQATDGDFYGTTPYGGANAGGTVFKITPGGALTTLYNFCTQANCTDGDLPSEALVQATNGKLYGTTADGGGSAHCGNGCGTVFEITPAGNLTTLHPFEYAKYGALPARLVQATNGNFYGTTSAGGDFHCDPYGCGTIFKLAVGLGPFVETLPTSGKVGTAVIILGNQLKGTTSVTFNGTAATFTVVSNTEIKTIVPTGATTGFVEVTTLTKTLKSNVVFRVTK